MKRKKNIYKNKDKQSPETGNFHYWKIYKRTDTEEKTTKHRTRVFHDFLDPTPWSLNVQCLLFPPLSLRRRRESTPDSVM
jgi:hypothetical protein